MAEETANHEFDFWLGEWELTWGDNDRGTNHIERVMDGAAIQENFECGGFEGMSVSVFSKEDSRWHQTWVDSSGSYLDFVGEVTDGKMILARNGIVEGKSVKQRMIWYDIAETKFQWKTGNAQMMRARLGVCYGKSSTNVRSKQHKGSNISSYNVKKNFRRDRMNKKPA
mgnify:CR=1 FL=1